MGLMDPESTTQNYDTLYSKYKDGAVLFSPWPWLGQAAYNVTEHVEQNVKGVYIKSGSRVRFVQVFSDATIDGYAVCKLNLSSSEKEQLVTSRTIQLYDEVIVEGTDLYDGKML